MRAPEEKDEGSFDELVYKRELNEVHLLIDFVSGHADTRIWNLDLKVFENEDEKADGLSVFKIYERISELRYPPTPSPDPQKKPYNATILMYVKDQLTSLASPARGMTIAYTYIFLEQYSLFDRLRRTSRKERQTKATVARAAFPGLVAGAAQFRRARRIISTLGVVVTLLAAYLLWLAVYGAQLTKQFEENRAKAIDFTTKIYTEATAEDVSAKQNIPTMSVPKRCCWNNFESQTGKIKDLCGEWSYYQARYDRSIADAGVFAGKLWWFLYLFPNSAGRESQSGDEADACPIKPIPAQMPANRDAGAAANAKGSGSTDHVASEAKKGDVLVGPNTARISRQEDVQSVGLVVSAYSTYVLPVLFGFIGSIASFLRDTGNKIVSSTLSPRDDSLAVIRLTLGLIAGIAVGLFYNPTAVAGQVATGAGILALSASGIAFLAGYAADSFFNFLDGLCTRIFAFNQSTQTKNVKPL